ncbi:MAG: hypothetical protein ACOYL3_16655 [Desulfuromonadaceae bacterium]
MNKRISIICTITAAAVLVSSIAYASKKKLRATPERLKQGISEVDLAATLLDTSGEFQQKSQKECLVKKHGDDPLKDLTMVGESTSHGKAAGR